LNAEEVIKKYDSNDVGTIKKNEYALILTGDALIHIMKKKVYIDRIMDVGLRCKSTLACRVSPK